MEVSHKTSNTCKSYVDCYLSVALTFFFSIIAIVFFIIWQNGNITKFGTPYDINADVCGENIPGRNLLYYPDPNNFQFPICINKCPTATTKGVTFVPNNDGAATTIPLRESKLFLGHYCLPNIIEEKAIKETFSSEFNLQIFFQDIFKAAELFFVVVFTTFLLFYLMLIALYDSKTCAVISICLKFFPMIFSIALSGWVLYSIPADNNFNVTFWISIIILNLISFIVTLMSFLFPETFERSKLSTLMAIQAIQEMPDLFFCITVLSIGVGSIIILSGLSCIEMFSIGRFIPIPLRIKSTDEIGVIGIASNIEYTLQKYILCSILLVTLRLFFETINAFFKMVTVKSVKMWFEIPPSSAVRSPSCNIVFHALKGSVKHIPAIYTAAVASLLRFPSMIIQFAASERVASNCLNEAASKLYGYLGHFESCRKLYNSLSFIKLSDASGCCYFECAMKSYLEIINGVAPDHQAGKKYRVEEMISSLFNFVACYTLFLLLSLISWTLLQFCPSFSPQGEKELYSAVSSLGLCMILAGYILLIFYEFLETLYATIILLWFKATSDLGWDSFINSDTVVEFESRTLSQYVQYMQRSAI